LTVIAIFLFASGLALVVWARLKRRETGLPIGRVVYDDTGAWQECPRPFFSRRHLLTGKPDYIVAQGDDLIPVELKPRRSGQSPYDSDVLQVAAYCLLIEDSSGTAPPYGVVRYAGATFHVEYTPALRAELLQTMRSMRFHLRAMEVARSHSSPGRCRACGHREHCQQSADPAA
jgi:CRISPR-associated exonuclease Cas4